VIPAFVGVFPAFVGVFTNKSDYNFVGENTNKGKILLVKTPTKAKNLIFLAKTQTITKFITYHSFPYSLNI
jgi:hypothetical protein